MVLSRLQRRSLSIYREFQQREMSVGALMWANRRSFALFVLYFAVLAGVFYFLINPFAAGVVMGACLVAMLRDVGYMRRSAKVWPVLREVIQWDRVSEMLNANERNQPPQS
jgi:integrase